MVHAQNAGTCTFGHCLFARIMRTQHLSATFSFVIICVCRGICICRVRTFIHNICIAQMLRRTFFFGYFRFYYYLRLSRNLYLSVTFILDKYQVLTTKPHNEFRRNLHSPDNYAAKIDIFVCNVAGLLLSGTLENNYRLLSTASMLPFFLWRVVSSWSRMFSRSYLAELGSLFFLFSTQRKWSVYGSTSTISNQVWPFRSTQTSN